VLDPDEFDKLVVRYPTVLMYSLGGVARLDYFAYRNGGRKPNSREAKRLLMMPLIAMESWGDHNAIHTNMHSLLSTGTMGRAGRPRRDDESKKKTANLQHYYLLSYRQWISAEVFTMATETKSDSKLLQLEKWYGMQSSNKSTGSALSQVVKDACLVM
jgi:hypothetical protein